MNGAEDERDETHPHLRAQARSAGIGTAWRAGYAYAELAAAFDAVASDDVEAVAAVAHRLLSDPDTLLRLVEPLVTALRDDCWFAPPFGAGRDMSGGAVLFDHPAVTIGTAVVPAGVPEPASVTVSGRLALVCYARASGARLRLWNAGQALPDFASESVGPLDLLGTVKLHDGMVLRIDGRARAAQIEAAQADVLTITAIIRAGASPVVRDYALPSGELVRLVRNDGAEKMQALLACLRDAQSTASDTALRDGAFFLRWAAIREWLALDALAAFPRLSEVQAAMEAELGAVAEPFATDP